MSRQNPAAGIEVGYRAGNAKDPGIRPCCQAESCNGMLHLLLGIGVEPAVTAKSLLCHLGIAVDSEGFQSADLDISGGKNPFANHCRFFAFFILSQGPSHSFSSVED